MRLPEINDEYADFVLTYAKRDGLNSLVRKLELNADKTYLQADLQPDLIQAFSEKFPGVDLIQLDNAVEWILVISAAKSKENRNNE